MNKHSTPTPKPLPLRIQVDKRPTNYNDAMNTQRWFVYPCERDYRGSQRFIEYATYELRITYNGMTGPAGDIRFFAHKDGEEFEMLYDEFFEARVADIAMHEDMSEDDANSWLVDKNIWPESSMRTFGFNTDYFERMVIAWKSALQFIDFTYTL